jgi:hypothetical protein
MVSDGGTAAILAACLLLPPPCRPPGFLDPALLSAWALLRGVEVEGRPLGAELADARERAGVRIAVGPLDPVGHAEYHVDEAVIVVGEALLDEDPRTLAAVLVHVRQGPRGLLTEGHCALNEAGALVHEAAVWQVFTGGDMPSRMRLERALTRNAALVRGEGLLGVFATLYTGTEAGRAYVVR